MSLRDRDFLSGQRGILYLTEIYTKSHNENCCIILLNILNVPLYFRVIAFVPSLLLTVAAFKRLMKPAI